MLPPIDGDPSSYAVSAITHHQQYEQKKFTGCNVNTNSSYIIGEQVIAALNASNTILIPFTVDPFVGLGPIASRFLFGITSDPLLPPMKFRHRIPQQAYDNAISATSPTAILLHADKSWHHNSSHLPFGATYHSWFPSTWARQMLGANINSTFSEHIYDCIHGPNPPTPNLTAYEHPLALGTESRTRVHTTTQPRQERRVGLRHTA